jgi:hypothetical protein
MGNALGDPPAHRSSSEEALGAFLELKAISALSACKMVRSSGPARATARLRVVRRSAWPRLGWA